ncbi:MAG TPA: HAMP domain-containing sensor histidine kinase [Ignavibacteriaceae bacterium]|nr:MAG: Sensor protein CzcS precursor [Ignavibacteria bacterium ADurb.Bin266]OQY70567.1 MAG: hypothetical protein B6D44_15575 [Ignavibacteriales bacterium UTCHB2]HQF43001.1 HAMP domain-containing sensor histidine kinase [Ignavibacteriaceae bacterium]HQI42050.1 HAMP domain-containing sensor histidine kinase [Ignavibacteriaceae bacterium]
MKLINKISNYFLFSAALILIVFAVFLFFIIENTIKGEMDEQLINIYKKVVRQLSSGKEVGLSPFVEIEYKADKIFQSGFSDVNLKTDEDNDDEYYRQYSGIENINGNNVFITVRISMIEKDEMFYSIFLITIGSLILIVLIIFLINKYISQKVFKDFYATLEKLENFSVSENKDLQLSKSDINEFSKLNEVVEKLSHKARGEYRSLKKFTEETNHEIQTPVAIVKSKLEMLLQSNNLKEKELNSVKTAIGNLNKLERINKSILLLNKLDHHKLFENSQINLSEEIKNILSNYSEAISEKKISLKISIDENINIIANHSLINILINNLIVNSIKHNVNNGEIEINLKAKTLNISNTGLPLKRSPEEMFEEFHKDNPATESAGLGLAIARKICNLYHYKISYKTEDKRHHFNLEFQ